MAHWAKGGHTMICTEGKGCVYLEGGYCHFWAMDIVGGYRVGVEQCQAKTEFGSKLEVVE